MAQSILVVEDTDLLRKIYTDKLSSDGYNVHAAGDGLEALSILRMETVDLILLDLIMPKMSGLEALEAIKADPRTREIPVLILSNLGQESDVERGLSMGAVDYMVKNEAKPADVAEKIAAILDLAGGRQTEAQSFKVFLKDRVGDVDALVEHAGLPQRFWCPPCEVELQLELLPQPERHGWYDCHFFCPMCGKEY
jgi:CheY-like chemotaxis protein